MADQTSTNAAVQNALTSRPITAAALLVALGAIVASIFQPLGGSLTGSLPNPVIANGAVTAAMLAPGVGGAGAVPTRVATGTTAATTTADYLLCLNGPTSVQLESAPPLGTTHVLKDCRAAPTPSISILASSPDTIDGGSSVAFTFNRQAMVVSYTAAGWLVY